MQYYYSHLLKKGLPHTNPKMLITLPSFSMLLIIIIIDLVLQQSSREPDWSVSYIWEMVIKPYGIAQMSSFGDGQMNYF